MWDNFLHKLNFVVSDPNLRNRLLFVLAGLVVFTSLRAIPVPGVDTGALADFFSNQDILGFIDIFTGGGLSAFSIVMLGVGPFITASIIMQLMTVVSPKIKSMYQEEGEVGRRKFIQIARMMTVPIAAIQSFGFLMLLQQSGVISGMTPFGMMTNIFIIIAASVLLMWIGELISEFGIGNGVSLLIFAGIVASLPGIVQQQLFTFSVDDAPLLLGFGAISLVIIFGIVVIMEAERPIPITYAKSVRGQSSRGGVSTYLPLRLNQGGVIPIIFALSILMFPQTILQLLVAWQGAPEAVSNVADWLLNQLAVGWINAAIYFLLVFGFTFFYVAITFDPANVANNLKKNGAFIPGVRPGEATAEHIGNILTRLTLIGAIFLSVVAVLPLSMQAVTGDTSLAIGGTALLIIIAVITDLIKKIDAQIALRQY